MLYSAEEIAKETAKHEAGIVPYTRAITGLTVTTPEDAELAARCAEWAHETEKDLTRKRDEILGPIADAVQRVRALFAPAIQACQRAKAHAKGALSTYYQSARETNVAQMHVAAAAAQAGDAHGTAQAAAAMIPIAAPAPVRLTETWTYRVTAPDLVPREFLTVDYRALDAYAKAGNPQPVAGVVFERTVGVAMRAKRNG